MKDFVPDNLGPQIKTREEWLKHNTYIAENLLDSKHDQLILVADGTYCYCQKSKNNTLQRELYSSQKSRHLVKPFVICTTDGFIVDIYGLYEANKNDAKILSEIFKTSNDLRDILKPDDIFVVDRGFRDCVQELKKLYNINVRMPELLKKGKKQFDTIEANQSRLITKIRWTVEVINTFLKNSFKALKEVSNQSLPHTHDDYRIAGALINKFFNRLFSDKDDQVRIVENMKHRMNVQNDLKDVVEKDQLHKKSLFTCLNSDEINDFPMLDEDDIKTNIVLGSYQLKQAEGYIGEHFNNGKIEIRINKNNLVYENTKIMFAIIQSRHSKSTKYKVYVQYNPNIITTDSIKSWFCTCKSGSRTVGCCSHIAAIIWYFACGKYQSKIPMPGVDLWTSIFPSYNIKKSKLKSNQ